MSFNIEMINRVYANYDKKIKETRDVLKRPLMLAEKILYAHLDSELKDYKRGEDFVNFKLDRVVTHDIGGQTALLQFMQTGKKKVDLPTSAHCDHLITGEKGQKEDLPLAEVKSKEVYTFLRDASNKYGIDFWGPGSGIIHQIILENYAFRGMIIGTDSHCANAGGLGMISVGVGGADIVDAMAGLGWELKFPRVLGVKLTGELQGWTSPKDVILKLAGMLTVKGGTDKVIEYFGEGTKSLSATGKATICNMGAEVGATTSVFPYDNKMEAYLKATKREDVLEAINQAKQHFSADKEVLADPSKYYDEIIEIDLSTLEPHINGPFTPDKAWPLSEFADAVKKEGYPKEVTAALIGSCTNSSYQDYSRVATILKEAKAKGVSLKTDLFITPGSEKIRKTIERDGMMDVFKEANATVLSSACGPCIGQWNRKNMEMGKKNSIITSFNRNFAKRNDGNPNTHGFLASPEMVLGMALTGDFTVDPTKPFKNDKGEEVTIDIKKGVELPPQSFETNITGYEKPLEDGSSVVISIDKNSDRLQELTPFPAWDGKDILGNRVLIKIEGKCTTDHISMAGPWLKFRGHLENISNNLLIGAKNVFNGKVNLVKNYVLNKYVEVPESAKAYKKEGIGTVIVGDENYGEGSSREHAAMEPRFLGVRAVLAKSFARIHESNLKKQGVLALNFKNKDDWNKVQEEDVIDILNLDNLLSGKSPKVRLNHSDGQTEEIEVVITYNQDHSKWFKYGSALNYIRSTQEGA